MSSENEKTYEKALEVLKVEQDKIKLAREYTKADKIIRYLTHPDDESIELTDPEKERLTVLKEIHALRMRYARKSEIINILIKGRGIKERQAYNLINDCEYVFGSLDGVNKAYERSFLMEASRKNIQLAFASGESAVISKALREHYRICGLAEVIIDMPDFSSLEPNDYVISLPENQQAFVLSLIAKGYVNMSDFVPHENITFNIPHQDVSNQDEKQAQ